MLIGCSEGFVDSFSTALRSTPAKSALQAPYITKIQRKSCAITAVYRAVADVAGCPHRDPESSGGPRDFWVSRVQPWSAIVSARRQMPHRDPRAHRGGHGAETHGPQSELSCARVSMRKRCAPSSTFAESPSSRQMCVPVYNRYLRATGFDPARRSGVRRSCRW